MAASTRPTRSQTTITGMSAHTVTGVREITNPASGLAHVIEFRTQGNKFGAYCRTCGTLITASTNKTNALANVQVHTGTFAN